MKEINIKKGRPLLNYILVTADVHTAEELQSHSVVGLVDTSKVGKLKEYQKVVAISPRLTNVPFEVGDMVLINFDRYGVPMQQKDSLKTSTDEYYNATVKYNVPIITLDGIDYLRIGDNDIEFIIDEFEFVESKLPTIVDVPPLDIIIPGKGKHKLKN